MRKLLTVLIVFPAVVGALQAQSYRFGRVWDGEKVLTNAVIVVENGRIKSVGTPSGDTIDMTRYTALPGLIPTVSVPWLVRPDIQPIPESSSTRCFSSSAV